MVEDLSNPGEHGPSHEPDAKQQVLLSVGLPREMATELAGSMMVMTLRPAQISAELLEFHSVGVVACPLMDRDCDALTVIEALRLAGYEGVITIISPPLPNVRMVERELIAEAGTITIRLLTL